MKQVELREGARRQHRVVALLGVLQCWTRKLDAICFQRHHIERLVGIERFRGTRVMWLKEDLAEYFPHLNTLVYSGDSFASIFASRVSMIGKFPSGKMSDDKRAKSLTQQGIACDIFSLWECPSVSKSELLQGSFDAIVPILDSASNYDERLMAAYLWLLSCGAISLESVMKACQIGKTTTE